MTINNNQKRGRPVGSRTKNSWGDVFNKFQEQTGKPFAETLVENYVAARDRGDWALVATYDRAILNKLAPDLHQIEMSIEANIQEREQAFAQALADLSLRNIKN